MSNYKCILFDCMETVVDVIIKPDAKIYSYWAYNGCGYEILWKSFDAFADDYAKARKELSKHYDELEEYSLFDRFKYIASQLTDDINTVESITKAISNNYWRNYKSNCIVYDNVKSTLSELSAKYRLGVVSNFMVEDGIEELLEMNGVDRYFDFVVTSIKVGWKKPHDKIYDTALGLAKVPKKDILFVGDNYDCDYSGPMKYGFDAVLLDKEHIYSNAGKRIKTLDGLAKYLK